MSSLRTDCTHTHTHARARAHTHTNPTFYHTSSSSLVNNIQASQAKLHISVNSSSSTTIQIIHTARSSSYCLDLLLCQTTKFSFIFTRQMTLLLLCVGYFILVSNINATLNQLQIQLKGSVEELNKFHIYETEKITRKTSEVAEYIELFGSFTQDRHARRI